MTIIDKDVPLPLEWNEWRRQWMNWLNAHLDHDVEGPWLWGTNLEYPGDKNFLATEILGIYELQPDGLLFEFSECRFLDARFVGVSPMIITEDGKVDIDDRPEHVAIAFSFAELESIIFPEEL